MLQTQYLIPNFYSLFSEFQKIITDVYHKIIRKNYMHPDVLKPFGDGWVAPTPKELAEFKTAVGWSTNELAKLVNINPKHLRNYLKDRSYVQGMRIPYPTWRLWLESFGLIEPAKIKPAKPYLRATIFSDDANEWAKPNISEVRVLATRSGLSDSAIARILDLELPLVKHLLHSHKVEAKSLFHVTHEQWKAFLKQGGVRSIHGYLKVPTLPDETLLPFDQGFVPPKPKVLRQFIAWTGFTAEQLAEQLGVEPSKLKFFTTNRSARDHDVTINQRVFSIENWQAPSFVELRTFMKVLSLDPMEIAHRLKFGQKEMKVALATTDNEAWKKEPMEISQDIWFKLLDSLQIFNTDKINKLTASESRVYHIHYSTWRLMLQTFGIVEPLKLERKTIER
jgi:AraC-like DNA-binding protein